MILRRIGGAVAAALLVLVGALLLLGGGTLGAPAQATGACGGAPSISLGTGAIAWPIPAGSYTLTSGYGPRWGSFHHGIDLAAPVGTPMYAAHDGIVEEAGAASGFGLWVVVTGTVDGQTVSTVYGHNNVNRVVKGQRVAAGDHIADVGNRGESTGPHLHFEVWPGGRFGGASTDPAGWLASNVRPGQTTTDPVDPVAVAFDPARFDLGGPVSAGVPQATMPISDSQRANAETIVAVAKAVGFRDEQTALRAAVIGVATAMQESRLTVIDYGDAAGPDSRGLFQQRAPWGSWAERMDPVASSRFFFTGGSTAPDGWEEPGLMDIPGWESMELSIAAEAVQRFRTDLNAHYSKWEQQAIGLVAAAAGIDPAELDGQLGAVCAVPAVA